MGVPVSTHNNSRCSNIYDMQNNLNNPIMKRTQNNNVNILEMGKGIAYAVQNPNRIKPNK